MFGAETASQGWASVGRKCHSYAPAALLGWSPGIAVVRTTFLKVGLNVFHCWKICHYGHFLTRFLDCHAPQVSSHSVHFIFSLIEAYLFYFCISSLCLCGAQKSWALALLFVLGLGRCDFGHNWTSRT
jgi:hypothetical protein